MRRKSGAGKGHTGNVTHLVIIEDSLTTLIACHVYLHIRIVHYNASRKRECVASTISLAY